LLWRLVVSAGDPGAVLVANVSGWVPQSGRALAGGRMTMIAAMTGLPLALGVLARRGIWGLPTPAGRSSW